MAVQKQDDQHEHTVGMLSRRPAWGDGRQGKVAREGQGYPCYQHNMMMMMMMSFNLCICPLGYELIGFSIFLAIVFHFQTELVFSETLFPLCL